MARELLISVVFEPYMQGRGPTFGLSLTDTGRVGEYGKHVFHYKLTMTNPEVISEDAIRPPQTTTLFEGEDFQAHYRPDHPQGLHNLNSLVDDIMCFLTLRPGDTDEEYFKDYNEMQLEYCKQYAEELSCEAQMRFGRD